MPDCHCTQCGAEARPTQNFCGRCGTALHIEDYRGGADPDPCDGQTDPRATPAPEWHAQEPGTNQPVPTPARQPTAPPPSPHQQPTMPPGVGLRPIVSGPVSPRATNLALLVQGRAEPVPIPLDGSLTIGSNPDCDIVLDEDPYVSAHHARVTPGEQGPLLADAQSTNGTFLRVTEQTPVKAGDEIRIGTTVVRVEMTGPGA